MKYKVWLKLRSVREAIRGSRWSPGALDGQKARELYRPEKKKEKSR